MRDVESDRTGVEASPWLWVAVVAVALSPLGLHRTAVAVAGQLLGLVILGALWWWRFRPTRQSDSSSRPLIVVTVIFALMMLAVDMHRVSGLAHTGMIAPRALDLGVGIAGAAAVVSMAMGRARTAVGCAAVAVCAAAVLVLQIPTHIDVALFLHDSARAVLSGHDPYSLTFQSPYDAAGNRVAYSPQVVSGSTLNFGFPYPPPILISGVVGYVLGDVRIGGMIALVLAAIVLIRRVGPRGGLLLLLPGSLFVFENAWVEPAVILLLVLTVVSALDGSRWTPLWLGLLLVSKQYFVVVVPVLVLLLPVARAYRGGIRRFAGLTVAVAVLAVLPFLLWDPAGFWRSVVTLQFLQPFRSDSESALVLSVNTWHWPPPSTYGWLPLLGGFVAACAMAWRAPRTPAGFSLGVGFTLLVLVTLGKQAFANYFYLIEAALLLAAVTWSRDREPSAA